MLFILVVETLAEEIRNATNIKGIMVDNCEVKLTQLADDMTLFVKDHSSFSNAIQVIKSFGLESGLKLNLDKTKALELGPTNMSNPTIKLSGLKTVKEAVKVLGIWICKDLNKCTNINFTEKIKKLETIINMWKTRNLTIRGKIIILQSLALSQVYYAASVLHVPDDIVTKINDLIFKFIWNKKEHVKRKVIIQDLKDGGLKMPEFRNKVKAMKIMWIKRLAKDEKWSLISKTILNLPMPWSQFVRCKSSEKYVVHQNNKFYRQILEYYYEIYSIPPTTANEIRAELIFNNRFILVNNKPIFHRKYYDNGIVYINDLFDNNGSLLSIGKIAEKIPINNNSMVHAIPKNWKEKLKGSVKINVDNDIKLRINNQMVDLQSIATKTVYWHLVDKEREIPASCTKWEKKYGNNIEWQNKFVLPHKTTKESLFCFSFSTIAKAVNTSG